MMNSGTSVTQREMTVREKLAFHEAGHAVAAMHLGRTVRRVTIERDEDTAGSVEWDEAAEVEINLLVIGAGEAASRIAATGLWQGADDDRQRAQQIAPHLPWEECVELSRKLLEKPELWGRVERLAAALLTRPSLGKVDIVMVLAQSETP